MKLTLIRCYHLVLNPHSSFANDLHDINFTAKGSSSQQKNHVCISCQVSSGSFSLKQLLILSLILMSLAFLKTIVQTCVECPSIWVWLDVSSWFDLGRNSALSGISQRWSWTLLIASYHVDTICTCPSPGDVHLDPSSRVVCARFLISSDSVPFHKYFVETIETRNISFLTRLSTEPFICTTMD